MTAADYEKDLEGDLDGLLDRIKSGRYFAPPVRRRYIPKAYGTKRPLGIPALEDKVAQLAIPMLLEPVYEADFLPCSYGFRPGRSAHDALNPLRKGIIEQRQRWVIDADLRSYSAATPHVQEPLRASLDGVGHDLRLSRLHPRLGAPICRGRKHPLLHFQCHRSDPGPRPARTAFYSFSMS